MKNKKVYFTTGEFAALCNVGKDTLYHKDIKAYLNNRSPENFTELLERQMPVIDEKIRKLENIKKIFIEKKTNIASFEEKRGVVLETYQEEDEEYFCSESWVPLTMWKWLRRYHVL